jgi:hypothetical protein
MPTSSFPASREWEAVPHAGLGVGGQPKGMIALGRVVSGPGMQACAIGQTFIPEVLSNDRGAGSSLSPAL